MLAIPAVAALVCLFLDARGARWLALGATLLDLALGVVLWANFDIGGARWQFQESHALFGGFGWMLGIDGRSEEHTSELQSLMRISYAVLCLKKKNHKIK